MSLFNEFKLKIDHTLVDSSELIWIDEKVFDFRKSRFITDLSWGGERSNSDNNEFILVKNKLYIDTYFELLNYKFNNIFEIGFFEGGSSVFYDLFYHPQSLTCVDRRKDIIGPVKIYIDDAKRGENFRMIYDFDQGDIEGLVKLTDEYHPNGLDLVIDDASHQYELTKKSFSVLFPRLNPGGIYVIEDYGWAHDSRYQADDHIWRDNPSLTNLVFELVMVCAGDRTIIESVYMNRGLCFIRKGMTTDLQDPFDPSSKVLCRSKQLNLI